VSHFSSAACSYHFQDVGKWPLLAQLRRSPGGFTRVTNGSGVIGLIVKRAIHVSATAPTSYGNPPSTVANAVPDILTRIARSGVVMLEPPVALIVASLLTVYAPGRVRHSGNGQCCDCS
jgi:hypothetical protein